MSDRPPSMSGQGERDSVAWTVSVHITLPPAHARLAARRVHHAPFPRAPHLLARAVTPDARGLRVRYLFATASAAAAFEAGTDTVLSPYGTPRTGPARAVPAATLTAPVVIIAPPRSGSTALFDALARHPGLWTTGGESEGVIEGVPGLHPAACGYASHALDADHAVEHGQAVRAGFMAGLRDSATRHRPAPAAARIPGAGPRLLEKTPENTLRLPFLLRLFPDATVIHLRRDARDTVASMVRAWSHPAFVNIPDLPGWPRRAWHLLLPPGWQASRHDDLSRVAARQWSAAVEAVHDARALLPADRWLDVDYAELRAAPARTIRRLEAALGLPPARHGWDMPLSATTISPPHPGKWRRTPGFAPKVLDEVPNVLDEVPKVRDEVPKVRDEVPKVHDEVKQTRHTLENGRATMAHPEPMTHRRPAYACWLEESLPSDAERAASSPDEAGTVRVDAAAVLQTGVTIPLGLARHARFRDRFLPGYPILWTRDARTGALVPFWVRREDLWVLRDLEPGQPLPPAFPDRLKAAMAAAGALGPTGHRTRTEAAAASTLSRAADDFARTDMCRIGPALHPAHRATLLDYYERLISTGSWPLGDAQVQGRYGWHNESLSRFFHHQFRDLVSRLAGRPVRPSYSYVSAYRGGAVLDRHTDREQCEYTVSLLLGESGPGIDGGWPLSLQTPQGRVSVVQRPGEAVLFRGTRVPHWRPPLPDGSTHTSLLFHYVPADFRRTLY
ncbi:sulfotransferase [Streptomyces sp. NPDC057877]|uniref:sulfotransferase n=1 Tax=Streptomyces sp. NPDC057877 TaxID=3346269 RepID=UPI00369EC4DA